MIVFAVGVTASASAGSLSGFTFTGSVTSATSACPYPAKASLAGYTLIKPKDSYEGNGDYIRVIAGPALVFSPGGNAAKLTIKLGDLPDKTSVSTGSITVISLPSTNTASGVDKATLTLNNNGSFLLKLNLSFPTATGNCATIYNLSFVKGLPANLFNLL
jgi:hypothetical protein